MTEDNNKQGITQKIQLKPDKKKAGKHKKLLAVLRVLMGLSLVTAAVFAFFYLKSSREYATGNSVYEDLRSIQRLSNESQQGDPSAGITPETQPGTSAGDAAEVQSAQQSSGQPGSSGNAAEIAASSMNFEPFKEINSDIVAWLFAEGRSIDLPVVQGTDNYYYLHHLFNKEANKLGTLFVDYQNKEDFSDRNTVIFGHNMNDGSMFSVLENYRDQTYYESFPEMDLYTPSGDYTIELFAGVVTSGDYKFIRLNFQDDTDFMSYIITMRILSTFESPVEINANDRIVTLSTCVYDYENARYVLFGKLVPKQ